ncbi:glycoside hydrolase family 6 protein [Frankia sp. R82]|uniref:glycoside hydrolase family 6 protein n=1 Tax=Frankia sp. R82 TaxID=2950553 RepID=UPI0020443797|nr:glycoside hydrolase family 6 protein [Frankia sp. R82]MCM3886164.1 glycoside hydrolase family 6 protein [Frankia sp. R82]
MPTSRLLPVAAERAGRIGIVLALVAVLAACDLGGGKDHSGDPGRSGSASAAAAVPAPDPTRCPQGGADTVNEPTVATPDGDGASSRAPQEPFLVDPSSQAAQRAGSHPGEASTIAPLVQTSTAFPVGDWIGDVIGEVHARAAAAQAAGATAVFMVYAIPYRDVGQYSAGGLPNAAEYRQFTAKVAAGIGGARAVIVLEPDALGQINELDAGKAAERYALLRDAVDAYGALPATSVYLDGANCGWTDPVEMAHRLAQAGVAHARGFAVNVSNYYATADEAARGEVLSRLLGGAHYVIDTSRNGRGPATGISDPWCNPPGRGLGTKPTTSTGFPHADAFLWIKTPGASDGECNRGNPKAGEWWPQAAAELVQNAVG